MLAPERRTRIMDLVIRNKSVLVKELSVLFDVTGETIRKDLDVLEKEGKLIKTYGGAYIPDGVRNEIDVSIREYIFNDSKLAIGQTCANLVREGDTVYLDDSTTCLSIAGCLSAMSGVMVITNSLKAAQVFTSSRTSTLLLAGGKLDVCNQSFIGEETREVFERHYADICFTSCRGMEQEVGFTDGNDKSGELRRIMLKHARRRYLVVDHTKLDRVYFYHIGDFELLTGVIIDQMDDVGWRRYFKELGIPVIEAMVKKRNDTSE